MVDTTLLSVEDVAERVKASPATVRRWLRSGQLRGIRLGGRKLGWRISEAELRRFLEAAADHEDEDGE
ncbi:MAG TPA: helix-turn-helix domain-containing protein [Dehalococcoidia bacterium]|nr:helix-turn-helix domain-containing protein [Dehalococcoidia bacterium]